MGTLSKLHREFHSTFGRFRCRILFKISNAGVWKVEFFLKIRATDVAKYTKVEDTFRPERLDFQIKMLVFDARVVKLNSMDETRDSSTAGTSLNRAFATLYQRDLFYFNEYEKK